MISAIFALMFFGYGFGRTTEQMIIEAQQEKLAKANVQVEQPVQTIKK